MSQQADDQARTIAFLSGPAAFGNRGPVQRIETHGALVFLSGDTALKLKRAVIYDYMDMGTPERRRRLLERELELNRPAAPTIYRDVLAITRSADGGLEVGGPGQPVDWVLRMWRFPAEDELTAVADRGALDDRLAGEIGARLARYHSATPKRRRKGAPLIGAILDELERVFAEFPGALASAAVASWLQEARASLARRASLLDRRGLDGHVRRAHGDLHLRNLVLIDGHPVPYDALEFDETLGTCDLIYDLGFLLMDLVHRGLGRAACRVLDAWLLGLGGAEDEGLAALPLFLSVRAAIRAMVLLQTDAARQRPGHSDEEVAQYLVQARRYLTPPPPLLVAVGGFSGSGKSVLARELAVGLGATPGAVILSSDLTRKAGMHGTRLGDGAYSLQARSAVYEAILARARKILSAGHAVILDATFLDPDQRSAVRALGAELGIPFHGFWLHAPTPILAARLEQRRGDASDADTSVLTRQVAAGAGTVDWTDIDASQDPQTILAAARRCLQGRSGTEVDHGQ